MKEDYANSRERLRALRTAYAAELPGRVEALIGRWGAAATAWGETRADLARLVQSLSGSAGTFGFRRLGELAKELEQLLAELVSRGVVPTAQEKARIASLLGGLRRFATAPPDEVPEIEMPTIVAARADSARAADRCVMLIEPDVAMAEDMKVQLGLFGWEVMVLGDTAQAAAALQQCVPAALVADVRMMAAQLPGNVPGGAHRDSLGNVPMVLLSANWDWNQRLAAVRAGTGRCMSKPVEYAALAEHLEQLSRQSSADKPYRILLVEQERIQAERRGHALAAAGMDVLVETQPEKVLEALLEHDPEAVLMDLSLNGCGGVEIARVIRQEPQYVNLPFVFLATGPMLAEQRKSVLAGVETYLEKSVADADLVWMTRFMAERSRALTALVSQDSLTGLLDHISFKLRLETELERTRRSRRPIAVAMVDIDHFKRVNDTYGHPVGDRVIRSLAHLLHKRLRKGDIIGRYGGEEFIVAMPDTAADAAVQAVDALREDFGRLHYASDVGDFACTFSSGVAGCLPAWGVEELVAAADQALYQAKRSGRNRVCLAQLASA